MDIEHTFIYDLVRAVHLPVYAEIGTEYGKSLEAAVKAKPGRIIAIDPGHKSKTMKRFPDVEYLHMTSDRAVKHLKHNGIKPSGIYIDGDHRYPTVGRDIRHYWELWDHSGFFGGHDFLINKYKKFYVVQAVTNFFGIKDTFKIDRRYKCRDGVLHIIGKIWFYIENKAYEPLIGRYL